MHRHRVIVCSLILATGFVWSGCARDDKPSASSSAKKGDSTSTTPKSGTGGSNAGNAKDLAKTTTTTGAAGTQGESTSQGGATSTPTTVAFTPPTDPDQPTLPMTATLASGCIVRGGVQQITIRTEPKAAVGYDSVYADGTSGIDRDQQYYGGNNGTQMPDSGEWKDTWTVSPQAPPGRVEVRVLGKNFKGHTAYKMLEFRLVTTPGEC